MRINYSFLSSKSKAIFHQIVVHYVRDENDYNQYAKLIENLDGTKLPGYERNIDYKEITILENKALIDVLMDDRKLHNV